MSQAYCFYKYHSNQAYCFSKYFQKCDKYKRYIFRKNCNSWLNHTYLGTYFFLNIFIQNTIYVFISSETSNTTFYFISKEYFFVIVDKAASKVSKNIGILLCSKNPFSKITFIFAVSSHQICRILNINKKHWTFLHQYI